MINDFHVHMGKSSRGTNYTVDDLLRSMDRFDIERSGLSILNGVLTPELNDRVMQAVKDHPDRIVGFGYINPREPKAIDEVRRCLVLRVCAASSSTHGSTDISPTTTALSTAS